MFTYLYIFHNPYTQHYNEKLGTAILIIIVNEIIDKIKSINTLQI